MSPGIADGAITIRLPSPAIAQPGTLRPGPAFIIRPPPAGQRPRPRAGHRANGTASGCRGTKRDPPWTRLRRSNQARASPRRAGVVTEEMLTGLPEPVCRYLRYTGVVGKPVPGTIRLHQKGRMRTGPGQPWLPLEAEEHYSVQPPGFVWVGTARLGPVAVARARDMYAEGRGRMLVKVASLWPVADASGEQTDQAAMMRYLSEMIWFPAAFLAGNISFEAVDDSSARVTLADHGRTATATLFFDQEGRVTDFVAKRYRTADASGPETWSTPVTGYGEFEELRLPSRGKAIYK